MKSYNLYLDDIRQPRTQRDWVIVRSFDEFVRYILEHGTPEYISFDHDLGEDVPSGMDCAKWLVENDIVPKGYNVHSANPVGAANIDGLMRQWLEHHQK